jgi:hypothetical protein
VILKNWLRQLVVMSLKANNMLHSGEYISNPTAIDGRKLKERVQKVVSESVKIILDVKQRSPKGCGYY